jgi:hypothetical protein
MVGHWSMLRKWQRMKAPHDEALRPNERTADTRRGGEDKIVTPEPIEQPMRIATLGGKTSRMQSNVDADAIPATVDLSQGALAAFHRTKADHGLMSNWTILTR